MLATWHLCTSPWLVLHLCLYLRTVQQEISGGHRTLIAVVLVYKQITFICKLLYSSVFSKSHCYFKYLNVAVTGHYALRHNKSKSHSYFQVRTLTFNLAHAFICIILYDPHITQVVDRSGNKAPCEHMTCFSKTNLLRVGTTTGNKVTCLYRHSLFSKKYFLRVY